jgi:hypothetical protein
MALTIQQIYDRFIETGIANDPRSKSEVGRVLKEEKKAYDKLDKKDKQYFDVARLTNPYADTRILFGDPKTKVKKLIAGIDFEAADLVMTSQLNSVGAKIDLAISHHPEGIALACLQDAMELQKDLYEQVGVPINVIEKLMDKEIARVARGVHPINHEHSLDVARLLDIPYMCSHTVADNCVYTYLKQKLAKKQPRTVGDVMDLLLEEPEYQASARRGVKPIAFTGSRKNRAGKITVTGFTGGTSGSAEIYESMKHAGVGTEIVMHCTKEHREQAEKHHINIVVAGHIASDSLGMNLLLDPIEQAGVEIVAAGGFTRVKRK